MNGSDRPQNLLANCSDKIAKYPQLICKYIYFNSPRVFSNIFSVASVKLHMEFFNELQRKLMSMEQMVK